MTSSCLHRVIGDFECCRFVSNCCFGCVSRQFNTSLMFNVFCLDLSSRIIIIIVQNRFSNDLVAMMSKLALCAVALFAALVLQGCSDCDPKCGCFDYKTPAQIQADRLAWDPTFPKTDCWKIPELDVEIEEFFSWMVDNCDDGTVNERISGSLQGNIDDRKNSIINGMLIVVNGQDASQGDCGFVAAGTGNAFMDQITAYLDMGIADIQRIAAEKMQA